MAVSRECDHSVLKELIMAIITISRELAALGDETAHELAKLLDYRFVDKSVLEQRITSYGFAVKKLEKYDERKPSFWASLSQDRDDYLHFLKTALFAEAEIGDCIVVGRGSSIVFKDLPAVVSVHLVAPMEIRLERVKSYFRCDDKRARQIIEQSDHDRAGFHRYFFDLDWKAGSNYHLTINMGALHPATAAEIIKSLKEMVVTEEANLRNRQMLQEMIMAQKVIHHVLYDQKVPVHFLEAIVKDGGVTLHGVANSEATVEAAVAAAREIAGAYAVRSEIQVVQEYSVMP